MNIKKIEKYLTEKYDFGYNVILKKPFFRNKDCKTCSFSEITDFVLNSFLRELRNNDFRIQKAALRDLLESDFVTKYNPFKSYFESLPKWNHADDYIKGLSSTLKTNNDELFSWAFKKWLVALVACSLDKEVSNHTLLVLIGRQGLGKSRWIEAILPEQLSQYINSDRLKLNDKDTYIQLSQNILIILEEISSFKPSEVDAIKEVISKNIIKLRKAYGTYAESYERRASFIGSSNNEDILVDVTGNRRFLVFNVESITHPEHIDLDKVFSQAYTLYKEGFQYWFDNDDVEKMEINNEDFRHVTLEEELLIKYFTPAKSEDKEYELLSSSEVINEIAKKAAPLPSRALSPIRMGKILKSKGFRTTKKNGIKKYIVKVKGTV